MPGAQCGETLKLRGEWTKHPAHGSQFKVKDFSSELPATVYGIRQYLGSGLVKGISKGLAQRIVKQFGAQTLKIISEDSARLQEVEGIGKQRARSIKEAWDAQTAMRDVMVFLQTYGVTVSQCLRIVKQFGSEARRILETEPYRVARETHGIGFKTADKIAINMGIANDSPQRIEAGIEFALQELQDEGHTAAIARELVDRSTEMLDTDRDKVRDGLVRLFDNLRVKRVDLSDKTVFAQLPLNAIHEDKIASSIKRIQNTESALPPIQREKAVAWAQEKVGFDFADAQREAILNALANKVSILTG
ncbi:MAG: helix-hairpin-helix domain-containing protein, partial [Verrucomicrobiota bacterium]